MVANILIEPISECALIDWSHRNIYQRLGIDWKASFPAQKAWAKGG
jgi:hypothetical protein